MFKWLGLANIADQYTATTMIYDSDADWAVVHGSDLEEGDSQGVPVWSDHAQDPILASNMTRRADFELFMVEYLTNDALIGRAPAINGRQTKSAQAHLDEQPA